MSFGLNVASLTIDVSAIRDNMSVIMQGRRRYISLLTYEYCLQRNFTWPNGIKVKNIFGLKTEQEDTDYASFSKSLNTTIKKGNWKNSYYGRLIDNYENNPTMFKAHNKFLSMVADDILPTDMVNIDATVYADICRFHEYGSMTREEFVAYANETPARKR